MSHTICNDISHLFTQHELEAEIEGPDYICDPTTYTADTDAPGFGVPGVGPYRYAWYFSSSPHWSPQNPGNFLGSTASVTLIPPAQGPIWIFVFVSSSDGVVVTDRFKVEVCEGASPAEGDLTASLSDFQAGALFSLSPNPAADELLIRRAKSNALPATYRLFNAYGQEVGNGRLSAEPIQTLLLSATLPNGCYRLSMATAAGTSAQTFLLHR